MTLKDFIQANKTEITSHINSENYRWNGRGERGTVPTPAPTYSDNYIMDRIINDESLYNWARREGCRV